jgi:3-hydroxybutyryl-CoA dehydratase
MDAHFSKTLTDTEMVLFSGITGDFNPLHIDAEAAENTRFKGRIVPGILTAGLISTVLGRYLPGPGAVYVSQQLCFTRPVRPGDTVHAYARIRELHPEKARVILDTWAEVRKETVARGESIMIARRRTP